MATKKYFPIQTATACRLKWAWSTIYLSPGHTGSCHRASLSNLTVDNFSNFHNTDRKLTDRQTMLDGNWPGHGCEYCKDVEDEQGYSDRMFQLSVPGNYPEELDATPTLTNVNPAVLEIFFKNTCNLACIYCNSMYSSRIEQEDKIFGSNLTEMTGRLNDGSDHYDELIPLFWNWLDIGYEKLQRIVVLGGEPFVQPDLFKLLEYIELHPNPNLELSIVSNLIINKKILLKFTKLIKPMLVKRKLKNIEILASVDCWGDEQEYIRFGFDCVQFEDNLEFLLEHKYIRLGIISVINSLNILSMPKLAEKFIKWNKIHTLSWNTEMVLPVNDHVLSPNFFNFEIYESALAEVAAAFIATAADSAEHQKFCGIVIKLKELSKRNTIKQQELLTYLTEIDRRRNLNWKTIFPWLLEEITHVV